MARRVARHHPRCERRTRVDFFGILLTRRARSSLDAQGPAEADAAAVEAGAEPKIVAGWMAEVQGERLAAERALAAAQPASESISAEDLRRMVEGLGDVAAVLARANPVERAKVYGDLGMTLTYRHEEDLVDVVAAPLACAKGGVGGGI